MNSYAKVIVPGSPISKSNFKLHNKDGRAILPYNTGKSHDRYALYEEEIAYYARIQNPNVILEESLIAVLKVYYKSEKRHPDTANITKSIFDGIEKSGLIVNDAQITRIITEEFYDKENPRFELEFYGESQYEVSYSILPKKEHSIKKLYSPIRNTSNKQLKKNKTENKPANNDNIAMICEFCNKKINDTDLIKANGGKTLICRSCFNKLF
ncbi:RusA family crossover junction endodeoxyribonuclease [Clostridium sp. 1001275B_160808_H3]|uniref:RusA family crossover junction endodeoxyribonuclease n=1 Tax=Clostridium sp. 1001275B_160808_H3 TaxID=2787110 RepID=UPI00189A76B8|nr:RusA family crossover junction endodeoxyribonuclease [Clostridium sp. 1001275B_160808_H3]